MIIYPAIDIRGGKAVRLVEGDFDRQTVFDANPVDAALRWVEAGASWIHIVDLDGAKEGVRSNAGVIADIRKAVPAHIRLQLGGGLRTLSDVASAFEIGIDRAIIGSSAVTNPDLVEEAVSQYGDRIAVGLDARDGKVATRGWLVQTEADALEIAQRFGAAGLKHVIFTDIHRDGTLQGPNLDSLRTMISQVPAQIIASGGVGSIDDVRAIMETGAAGVIIGSALYQHRLSLADALAITSGEAA